MGRTTGIVLYVCALVTVVVGVDILFFRHRFWERLVVNVGIVLVFTTFYLTSCTRGTRCRDAPDNAAIDNTACPKGRRAWWYLLRMIAASDACSRHSRYRHARVFGVTRIVASVVAAAAGIGVRLSYGVKYGWAAFFLAVGALNLACGYWDLTIARSASAQN